MPRLQYMYNEYNTVLKQGSKLNTFFIRLTSVYIDIRLEQFCLMRRFISISWGVSYNIALWVLHLSVRTWAINSVSLAAGYDPSRSSTLCLSRHFMLVGIIICANQSETKLTKILSMCLLQANQSFILTNEKGKLPEKLYISHVFHC